MRLFGRPPRSARKAAGSIPVETIETVTTRDVPMPTTTYRVSAIDTSLSWHALFASREADRYLVAALNAEHVPHYAPSLRVWRVDRSGNVTVRRQVEKRLFPSYRFVALGVREMEVVAAMRPDCVLRDGDGRPRPVDAVWLAGIAERERSGGFAFECDEDEAVKMIAGTVAAGGSVWMPPEV